MVIFAETNTMIMATLSYVLQNDFGQKYIEIPMEAKTRKYFQVISDFRAGFVYIRKDNWLGTALGLMSERNNYRRITLRRKSRDFKMKVVLPDDYRYLKFTEAKIANLGCHLDTVFRQQFYSFVLGATRTGCSDNFAVIQFLELHGITEEEWSLDTAKKAWRDYKKICSV